jgi:predicted ATP-dependent Lon-type protease
VGDYEGISHVLDLEACLDYGASGQNRQKSLFEAAKTHRIVVTSDVFKQVRHLDAEWAKSMQEAGIEIIDCDELVYQTVEHLAQLLALTSASLDKAAQEKLVVLALVCCSQNGALPKCLLVTNDLGAHKSSMKVLCAALKMEWVAAKDAF